MTNQLQKWLVITFQKTSKKGSIIMRRILFRICSVILWMLKEMAKVILVLFKVILNIVKLILLLFGLVMRLFLVFVRVGTL